MKQIMPKPLSNKSSQLLSYQLLKIYLYIQNQQKIKPDTFDFKSFPTFPASTISPSTLLDAFISKNSENSLCLEEVREDEIKLNEILHI